MGAAQVNSWAFGVKSVGQAIILKRQRAAALQDASRIS